MNTRRNTLQHLREQCRDKIREENSKIQKHLNQRLPPHMAAVSPNAVDMNTLQEINLCLDRLVIAEERLRVIDQFDNQLTKDHDDHLNYDTYSK
jgi:hypothetical protein